MSAIEAGADEQGGLAGPPRPLAFRAEMAADEDARIRALFPLLGQIEEAGVREAVVQIWAHAWRVGPWDDPAQVPFLADLPDWRLVDHVNAVSAGCDELARALSSTLGVVYRRDLLLAAALLHDVAKLVEHQGSAAGLQKTPIGRAVHHATIGAQWALEAGLSPLIAQAIFCHSPIVNAPPATPEAHLVRDVDTLVTEAQRQASAGGLPAPGRARGPY
ncbi:MAG TPA: HD domain-containing protein [Candidatus Nitrosotalea sp.]|nr:HD domain-containing protein [Candidatus Nitrosotalea sp.]